jgi:molybdopterin-containing oxidoreductase family iron-sulfur binding subunit
MIEQPTGQAFWQGLDQLIEQPGFRATLAERFPALAEVAGDWRRRDILKCLGATLALAGLDGCERGPDERALPFVRNPVGIDPGEERLYATAVELDGVAQPVVGKCRDGRPIKLDGNPDHPASSGASDAFSQAALLGLYDPGRSQAPQGRGKRATWGDASAVLFDLARQLDASKGAGFQLLTGPVGSPTLLRQIAEMKARWPAMRWHVHAPLAGFHAPPLPWDSIETLVAFDADPLGPGPYQTANAIGWGARRRAYQEGEGAAQLFVAEPAPSLTGVAASERLIARASRIGELLAGLSAALGGPPSKAAFTAAERAWLGAAARALQSSRGRALVAAGAHYPPELQRQAAAINAAIGAPAARSIASTDAEGIEPLVAAMHAGEARAVLVLDSNPVYSTAPDLGFAQAYARVPLRVHAGLHDDETAAASHWHLPLSHALESWSDARAADGSAVIVQPLVRPFYDVRSRHEVLALVAGDERDDRAIVRQTWNASDGDDQAWREALVRGWIEAEPAASASTPGPEIAAPPSREGLELLIRPDPSIHDGQFADNPWLQELPKPLTKLTWDNAIHVGPALAQRLGLENGDLAEIAVGAEKASGPIWIMPGLAPETLLVHLGYGRRAGGQVGRGVGFDAYRLRSQAEPWLRTGARLTRLEGRHALASTQRHSTMAGHDFVRFVDRAGEGLPTAEPAASFYPPQPRGDLAWGMAIDLDLCIGCNACVTACVAENNIAMVGKEQVAKGREMHWLRVDRYYQGSPEDPQQVFQPVPCMHCEDAPCEMGCPVNATLHSPDGLNLQVYNRCVGTRTCSAYCPYKVRHFNWFDFTSDDPPELRAARNPEVTVRGRGVMEKSTYCIQRIETEKIAADTEHRPMGAVKTACQQACPTQAIVFGNLADRESEVSRRKADPRDFALLPEANTRPRTTYGARIRRGERKA